MNLSELGIDPKEIRQQIIDAASQQVVEEISHEIQGDVRKVVQTSINKKINILVEETLGQIYQPIDTWGEPTGEATTLRKEFKKACENWWRVKVDDKGNVDKSYRTIPRYEWVAKKAIEKIITINLQKEFNKLIADTKTQVKVGVVEVINGAIEKTWSK